MTIVPRILTTLVVLAAAPLTGTADDTPIEWGEPSHGVVAGLRIADPAVDVGEPLTFKVEVRNPGEAAVTFPHMARMETWRLQFESEAGKLYEYSYFARGGPARPMTIGAGATQSLELPVMKPNVVGRFAPIPGLKELPAGSYRVWAFYQFAVPREQLRKGLTGIRPVTEGDQPDRLITNSLPVQIGGPPDDADAGWAQVGGELWQQHYRQVKGQEEVFVGTLESLPPRGPSTLMRDHGYRLGDRLIAGRSLAALDALVGKRVAIRGKRVDMNLSGVELREIAPRAIRPAAKTAAPERGSNE